MFSFARIPACSFQRLCGLVVVALCFSMIGCGANLPSTSVIAGGHLRGSVHGGQQPVVGANLQLYAAATTGYGASATPLLASAVTTDAAGSFAITGDYTCPTSTSELYLVATGGNPGLAPGTNNSALALMVALGPCSLHGGQYTLDPNSFITVNEVTTVASVYALAAFMGGDATHLGTSSTNAVGLANSFALVNNLVNTATGSALTATPAGNGTAPRAALNTLGNILAACVNSTGVGSPCSALFGTATPVGGTTPTDTIQAIYDVARNPANNVSALYALATATPPFQPALGAVPNDWMLTLTYSGGGLAGASGGAGTVSEGMIAIDAAGNAWIPNSTLGGPYSVTELSSSGAILSGSSGFTGGGLSSPVGLALDPSGNAWVAGAGNVVEFSSSGSVLSGASGFTGGGLSQPAAIAVDGQGKAWVTDWGSKSVIKMDASGNIVSGSSGFSTGAASMPWGVSIDVAGDVWVGNNSDQTVTEFNKDGAVVPGGGGFAVPGLGPMVLAFDGNGNAWVNTNIGYPPSASLGLNNVAELDPNGVLLSPSNGYANCVSPGIVGGNISSCIWWSPDAFALDGAGNVWGVSVVQTKANGPVPNPTLTSSMTEMSNSGTILSGNNGYIGGTVMGTSQPNASAAAPQGIAIDGSGNVWMPFGTTVSEFVGAATPVVTPFSLGVQNGTLGQRP